MFETGEAERKRQDEERAADIRKRQVRQGVELNEATEESEPVPAPAQGKKSSSKSTEKTASSSKSKS